MIKRVFLIVLDSVGAGEAPDAELFGDVGAHTLKSVWETGALKIDNLRQMGIGNIEGIEFLGASSEPLACSARCREASAGKDTTVGHWEISGHVSTKPLPTFPEGFSPRIIEKIKRISGREILCNKPYSGTKVISDYGEQAQRMGALIVYTSADSVLQIAAHTGIVPLEELYFICETLREELVGEELGVGRIIARPFVGSAEEGFVRTSDRRDYSIKPPVKLLPQAVADSGLSSVAIGKISDIFASVGFTDIVRTHDNREGMQRTAEYMKRDFSGLCFTNLVDFDMNFGHRRNPSGYALALNEFDTWLGEALPLLCEDDVLIITADHGCDPTFMKSTDHTREYTPLLIYGKNIKANSYGTLSCFAHIGATVADLLGVDFECDGKPLKLCFKN